MVPRGIVRWLLVGCLLVMAGCANRHGVDGAPIPLETFCGAFFDAMCEPLAQCECGDTAIAICRGEEAALCRGFPSAEMASAVDEGRLRYDGVAARALIDTMERRATTCTSFVDALDWQVRDLLSVGGVFEGTVTAGGTCAVLGFELISECALGSCALVEGAHVCRSAVGPGAPCDATHQCADLEARLTIELGIERLSLRCGATEGEGTCEARLPDGAACAGDAECESNLCEGICRSRELGERCRISRECTSGYCSVTTLACTPGDAPEGASCDAAAACASHVCIGGFCIPAGCGTF
jgi:hypothetical protein